MCLWVYLLPHNVFLSNVRPWVAEAKDEAMSDTLESRLRAKIAELRATVDTCDMLGGTQRQRVRRQIAAELEALLGDEKHPLADVLGSVPFLDRPEPTEDPLRAFVAELRKRKITYHATEAQLAVGRIAEEIEGRFLRGKG